MTPKQKSIRLTRRNPLTKKGRKIKRAMVRTYGRNGESVFYGSQAAGRIRGTHRNPSSGVRIVYNKLLGAWYIVRGPHQTPLGGAFPSKEAARYHLEEQQRIRDARMRHNPGARISRKGIYYFPRLEDAREYASRFGFPQDRIIRYSFGWAIQLRAGGPYVGPRTKPRVKGGVIVDADYYANPSAWDSYDDGARRRHRAVREIVTITGKRTGRIYAYAKPDTPRAELARNALMLANQHLESMKIERVEVRTRALPRSMPAKVREYLSNPTRRRKHKRPVIGQHVYSIGLDKLGTLRETFTDQDGMTRARVQSFNGEWWEETPPLSLLEGLERNPALRETTSIQRAARRFQRFTGHRAERVEMMPFPGKPKAGLAVGPVLMLAYSAMRDGKRENYLHKFAPRARPMLIASDDGRALHLLGGRYTFTERGIVDKAK